jgi:indole-3-glycerol phosphate synthase
VGMFQDEVAASQGIRIRRRPSTGPPLHYVGPFEFRLQNEGNTPRNILEEIIWHKDKEVSKVCKIYVLFFALPSSVFGILMSLL